MVTIEVTETGPDFAAEIARLQARLRERITYGIEEALKEWRFVVLNTTWFNPRPSPEGEIIGRWSMTSQGYEIEYGWVNYSGDPGAATSRAELRKHIAQPAMLEHIAASIAGMR